MIFSSNSKKSRAYVNIEDAHCFKQFSDIFYDHLLSLLPDYNSLVILCIGTDRATGDSLGPLIGYKLQSMRHSNVFVYGTLDQPVHAKNLQTTLEDIRANHENALIVAIDACLGTLEHIGYITIGKGSIRPGAGVKKTLPAVGDLYITGIVNFSGFMDMIILQNTRLSIVMRMADTIASGIKYSLWKYHHNLSKTSTTHSYSLQESKLHTLP